MVSLRTPLPYQIPDHVRCSKINANNFYTQKFYILHIAFELNETEYIKMYNQEC